MKLLECFQPFGLLEDPIAYNRKKRDEIKQQIITCQKKMEHCKQIYYLAREKVIGLRLNYMKVDRYLASMDGRLTICKPYKPEKKKKKGKVELTPVEAATKAINKMTESEKTALIAALMKIKKD